MNNKTYVIYDSQAMTMSTDEAAILLATDDQHQAIPPQSWWCMATTEQCLIRGMYGAGRIDSTCEGMTLPTPSLSPSLSSAPSFAWVLAQLSPASPPAP